jgi:hypothetical protein
MEDLLLKEAKARGMADQRGLYIAANVLADGVQLGRVWAFLNGTQLYLAELELPAGLGMGLRLIELRGARLTVKRVLVPVGVMLLSALPFYYSPNVLFDIVFMAIALGCIVWACGKELRELLLSKFTKTHDSIK